MSSAPTLAIVPAYPRSEDDAELLLRCLVSLKQTAPEAAVLVIDDFSPAEHLLPGLEQAADELGVAYVRNDEHSGFAATVNAGLELARAQGFDALVVHADVEFPWAGWLTAMKQRTGSDGAPAAVVGARLVYPSGLLQHAGLYFSFLRRSFGHRFQHGPGNLPEALQPCSCPVSGALMLIRHETLEEVGLFDERFRVGLEDVDYCLRVFAAGRECIYDPAAAAVHVESLLAGKSARKVAELQAQSSAWLASKHAATDLSPWTPVIA